jgi:hypothetical protein
VNTQVAIIRCEILTSVYGKEFIGLDRQTNMLAGGRTVKVLNYSDNSARVYYNDRFGGDILIFEKKNGEWKLAVWERTVWSKYGSADDFMWPYIR